MTHTHFATIAQLLLAIAAQKSNMNLSNLINDACKKYRLASNLLFQLKIEADSFQTEDNLAFSVVIIGFPLAKLFFQYFQYLKEIRCVTY